MGDAEITASSWRLVEVGRVVLIHGGPQDGKLAAVVEIIDHKRVRILPRGGDRDRSNNQITGSCRWTINRHQNCCASPIDRSRTLHPHTLSPRKFTTGRADWNSQEGVGEGRYWGEVARKCVGKEACPEGAETSSHRFRTFQGHEIAEAGTIWGPEITGKGQGCCEARIEGIGVWSWLHRVAGFLCFYGSCVCYVKRLQASMHMIFKDRWKWIERSSKLHTIFSNDEHYWIRNIVAIHMTLRAAAVIIDANLLDFMYHSPLVLQRFMQKHWCHFT